MLEVTGEDLMAKTPDLEIFPGRRMVSIWDM